MTSFPAALHYYAPSKPFRAGQAMKVDLCVYGGTSSGVTAALQGTRDGLRVVLIENSNHLGGLTAGGLGWTDFGNKATIGGLGHEFYRRVGQHYGVDAQWCFEPSVAEKIFNEWLAESGTPIFRREYLASVQMSEGRIESITLESGLVVSAKLFIDATYEGDLLARAGVRYTVGREANSQYGEQTNGMQVHAKHQFDFPVDPYRIEGIPASGLLPGIEAGSHYAQGDGDRRIQAYNFRMCLTNDPANRMPFEKPAAYDRTQYELLARYLRGGWNEVFAKFDPIPNRKTDTNNHGAVSTDFIGQNHAWPEASYAERETIFQAHVTYQKGLQWFLANDAAVPEAIRTAYAQWGLPKDEFVETGGWPHQLYIREARRMVSDYVTTEHNCRCTTVADDPVGLGAYGMDSHNCRRVLIDGILRNEGDVQAAGFPPYQISWRSLIPRRGECSNLIVPVCVSATHIAYGSIRMEPVFMVLGQSAAIAASLVIRKNCPVQDLPYALLREKLREAGQVLTVSGENARPNEIV
ncbi:FAD-dependent oxidoreductase [Oleiharenicola lentus]|uniref:FAD-dependent oxidoreductase n=1 Tax=Oleiharenicola lentus TaxID=2508720 RepID=UPI003F677AEF